jgi:cell wall assembly regulator SMI1
MTDFNALLDRLETLFLSIERQHHVRGLNPPASPQQIDAVERLIGYPLPAELRAFYLRFNGQVAEGWSFFPPFFSLPSLEELVYQWGADSDFFKDEERSEALAIVDEPSKLVIIPFWGTPKRVLVGKSNMSVFIYCDLDPGPAGKLGQIIYQDVQDEPRLWAHSFAEALNMIVTAAERGDIRFDADEVGWVRQDGSGLYGDLTAELAL